MQTLLQCIVSGILLGGLYAIIGIGLSIVFGIMKLTNIAHGSLMILASFFSMVIINNFVNLLKGQAFSFIDLCYCFLSFFYFCSNFCDFFPSTNFGVCLLLFLWLL